MLSPYRVLDLTNERGLLCGQILGDLGADVIKVEPPGGSPARRIGPFYHDEPHPDRSLFWWAYNRNKRGITLDIDTSEGKEILLRLVERAHFLIESELPGTLAARGVGYDDLAAINPSLIYVSITPFGQDGPKAKYADSDLVLWAAGGPLVLTGDEDRPPVRVSVPQAYLHAAADASVAALIAHHERQRSGRGQHVDVSAQQAVMQATFSIPLSAPFRWPAARRLAGGFRYGPLVIPAVHEAKDGYVTITFLFGSSIGPMTRRMMEWVYEEGFCDGATRDKDWIAYADLLFSGQEPVEELTHVQQIVAEFIKTKTKAELLQAALERGLLVAPITTIDEVAASDHLAARDYWRDVAHPEIGASVRYPGPFAKFSATPIAYRRRPPTVGEHNHELYVDELGMSEEARAQRRRVMSDELPLADVKLLDFMWVIAGPSATRILADYGATVVRVESTRRVDTARTMAPFLDSEPGPDNSALFHNVSAGKLGVTIDLSREEGRAVILDLVRWADVVTESFSPKAMRAWGLDYEALRQVKPDIIMLSTCLMGQSGPLAQFAGFGSLASAIAGFYDIAGWPDRPPAGPFGAYTDTPAPRFIAAALLAALDHRDRTGEGQHIDLSQVETALQWLGPALLDYAVNGRVQTRAGNYDAHAAPHGVYPAAGDDRWVAIAVGSDEQWRALCDTMDRAELAGDKRYATQEQRLTQRDNLDGIVAAWTAPRDAHDIEALLQARGVPASVAQTSDDLYADPQLAHRGHFVELEHPTHGTITVEGSHFRLSRTPARIERSGPTFGRDNQYVLETILGYSAERIAELVAAGVLE